MDSIFLEQVKLKVKLGVPAWERLLPQTIVLDITMDYDLAAAGKSDAIADTIDYAAVVGRLNDSLQASSFQLLEALAEHACQLILKEFGAKRVKVKVSKPGILSGVKALGIVMERS
jgi:7,8-dihydroneopterin aldolase/epimerase/oxygenase